MMAGTLRRTRCAWNCGACDWRRTLRAPEIDDFYPPLPGDAPPAGADYVEMYRLLGALKTHGMNHERACWPRYRRPASARARVWLEQLGAGGSAHGQRQAAARE